MGPQTGGGATKAMRSGAWALALDARAVSAASARPATRAVKRPARAAGCIEVSSGGMGRASGARGEVVLVATAVGHQDTAIHIDGRAGAHGGQGSGQERDRFRDLLRRDPSPERYRRRG